MNNIQGQTEKYCTGCGACVYICPVDAIKYGINKNGFYEAYVDHDKCINCGKCQKVCIKFKKNQGKNIKNGELIAARTKNEYILKTTTSGGIAYEIAKYGIENGYKIFGTIYDYEQNIAKAVIVDNMEELDKTKGSKYIQSKTDTAIKQLVEDCKANKTAKYIVFGTPCQIAGISNLLKLEKIENEILKIDLFCHGVPSYVIWKKYLRNVKEKYNLAKLQECNFRSKYYGWHQFCIQLTDEKAKTIYLNGETSEFYKLFFNNILLNKSCYNCKTRKDESYADIRLGDYWGKKYYNNQEGISAVLINTEKGKEIIKNISKDIKVIGNGNLNEFLKNQSVGKYLNENINIKLLRKAEFRDENLKEIIKKYKKEITYKQKIKIDLKSLMGKISPKCKYNFKKIYYNIKNRRQQ